jgi:Domain of unknown function (DUF4381)
MKRHPERSAAKSKDPVEVTLKVAPRDPSTAARDDWYLGFSFAIFLAQTSAQDIAPPFDYSLIPPWMIFVGCVLVLLLVGLLIWFGRKLFSRKQPTRSVRDRTLDVLERMETELERTPPYQFSIAVSDVLRRYVLDQFNLPMTRQTSIEFLNAIATTKNFSEAEKTLLTDFLDRCDLVKFARYDASTADSRLLLDEARRFVKGETFVIA